jgi:microcompartment protein PduB
MDSSMFGNCSMPEFVGCAVCDTIGLVIPNVDPELRKIMNIPKKFGSVGLIGSRTGAGAQIQACDEAVKSTPAEIVSIEIPRDTKGWGGHGNFIIMGSSRPDDVRRAVEIALEKIDEYCGEIYISEAGHMEFQFSARSGEAINRAFDVPIGRPFGFICASPAPIGMVIADTALKSAGVELIKALRPNKGTSHSNEVIIIISGEASAVKTAVISARESGMKLLRALGSDAPSVTKPYIR